MDNIKELQDKFSKVKNWTRTSYKNVEQFNEALQLENEQDPTNKKIAINFYDGEWRIKTSSPHHQSSTQLTVGERCTHQIQNLEIVGSVSLERTTITLTGDRTPAGLAVTLSWSLLEDCIVQRSTVRYTSGSAEFSLDCHETYHLDLELMYKSEHRERLRPFIETKLPSNLVRLPWVLPVPDSWCSCQDEDDAGLSSCPVHGFCEQCQESNSVCQCDWWYDQHFCNTCGLNLLNCECDHIAEIVDNFYEF